MMANKDPLATYKKRRNLKRSKEPPDSKTTNIMQQFVIQKHQARHLHYDFRLSINGILASWAIPKGPSLNPQEKRLAVRTDDHPLDYVNFEGVIPKGNYGAGTVMVWDKGTYKNIKMQNDKLVPMEECIQKGQIEIFLTGKKIKGGYNLIKIRQKKNQWLLIKIKDDYANFKKKPVNTRNKSVLSGRTMYQISKEEGCDMKNS